MAGERGVVQLDAKAGAVGSQQPPSRIRGFLSRPLFGGSASPVYSCRAKLGMQASSCTQAAVLTGLNGLCGVTFTWCASAMATTFLHPDMPPHRHRSGRT